MRIINTRPTDRAAPLTQALQQLGYEVFELPLLELTPLPLKDQLRQQFQQLLSADIVVVVSSIAAQLGVEYARQCNIELSQLQRLKWVAVGQATQQTLLALGLTSQCPVIENSEGMLSLDFFKDCHQQTVAFWRGIGGRTLMMQQLADQGCTLLNMILYRRQMPVLSQGALAGSAQRPSMLLVSSEASWKNWLLLRQQSTFLQENFIDYDYLVLGSRVSQVIKQDLQALGHSARVIEVEQLRAEHIHHVLQQTQL